MSNPLERQSAVQERRPDLSPLVEGLLRLLRSRESPHWKGAVFHVPEITAGAYFLYEQIRNAVEYREQHLFLRGAIERFLLRELKPNATQGLGFEIVSELTKTRYLANDTMPEDKVEYLDYIVARYGLLQQAVLAEPGKHDADAIATDIVQLLSVELERALQPNPTEAAIVEFSYASFLEHADIAKEDQMALYAAVHKAVLKSDLATIRYGVFSREFPRWLHDDDHMAAATKRFAKLNADLDDQLTGSQPHRMFRLVRRHVAPYLILREIIKTAPESLDQLVSHKSLLSERARAVAEEEYQVVSHRLRRSVIQAVIFLFITKVVLGILVEVPYELFVYGHIAQVPLAINLLFPPLYMAVVGLSIKIPGRRNTDKILSDLAAIVYASEKPVQYSLRRRGGISGMSQIFGFFYGLTSLATLGAISYGLHAAGFNVVSSIIFFVFLSTVSFFAYRISYSVREYAVIDEDPGVITNLSDFLLTPFIRVGQWLAEKYSRVNIFTSILDIIIETPFKTILKIIEQWNSFLRDKRDDVLR